MADLSKTAKASMKAGQAPKERAVLTPEKAIKTIREYREAHLAVLNMEYTDLLLAEYDKAIARIEVLEGEAKTAATTLGSLQNTSSTRIANLEAQVEGYKTIARQELELSTAKTEVIAELAGEPGTDSIGE